MVNFGMLALLLIPALAAPLVYSLGRKHRELLSPLTITVCVVESILAAVLAEQQGYLRVDGVLGIGVSFSLNAFSASWCVLSSLAWLAASVFSGTTQIGDAHAARFQAFSLMTLGMAQGVFLAADLYTAFVCFEMMTLGCYALLKHNQTPGSFRGGQGYLAVMMASSTVSLIGLMLLYHEAGSLDYGVLLLFYQSNPAPYAAGILAALGFAAQLGLFPMHVWIPAAYAQSPAPASALLSGIISKCGAVGLLVIVSRVFFGNQIIGYALLAFALATVIWSGVLALTSVDLKRALAYSSFSQMGFVALGISLMALLGERGAVASSALTAQMMNHAVQNVALFIAAGIILVRTGSTNLNKIQGYGRNKPVLMLCFLVFALSLGCVPGLSGYVSGVLLRESIIEFSARQLVAGKILEILFLLMNGLTIGYMAKLFICVFIERGDDEPKKERCLDLSTALVLGACALLTLLMGIAPWRTFEPLAKECGQVFSLAPSDPVHYFSWSNLSGVLISIAAAVLIHLFVLPRYLTRKEEGKSRRYIDPLSGGLDLMEDVYRPTFSRWIPLGFRRAARMPRYAEKTIASAMRRYTARLRKPKQES